MLIELRACRVSKSLNRRARREIPQKTRKERRGTYQGLKRRTWEYWALIFASGSHAQGGSDLIPCCFKFKVHTKDQSWHNNTLPAFLRSLTTPRPVCAKRPCTKSKPGWTVARSSCSSTCARRVSSPRIICQARFISARE